MAEHTVEPGDCIISISRQYGLLWRTIWDHPQNADLKRRRQDPNVLQPGDIVFIPDKQTKYESRSTGAKYRFVMLGSPAKFKLRLTINDSPRANEPYQLCIDGTWLKGKTDADGWIMEAIPPDAQKGQLLIGKDCTDSYEFQFGTVDPLDCDDGIKQRLFDLGYDAETDFAGAIRAFQEKEKLNATGQVDDATRSKLKEKFGQ